MSHSEQARAEGAGQERRSRRDLLRAGGAAAVAGLLGAIGLATPAAARNGDPLRAGRRVTATSSTTIESRRGPAFQAQVGGRGEAVALRGVSRSPKGIGVQGSASADDGESVGVQGLSRSSAGTAGQFIAEGGGTAIEARSAQRQGVALRTRGKVAVTERSGITPVSGGAEFVIPVTGGLDERSLILATLQDHFPGIHVESASVLDADDGLIVVRLNQAVPSAARVGWIVLD